MENASKALIMAAEVLIGVLIISAAVFIFNNMSTFSITINENLEANNVYEFNNKFEEYTDKETITPQDVISLMNLARDYNYKYNENRIIINLKNTTRYNSLYKFETSTENLKESKNKFIEEYFNKAEFECDNVSYDKSGRVSKIELYIKK